MVGRLGEPTREARAAVTALSEAYRRHEAESSAVAALRAAGVGDDRIRAHTGAPLLDVRRQRDAPGGYGCGRPQRLPADSRS
jgi:hypothetical protein